MPDTDLGGAGMSAGDPGQGVAVGDGQGVVAERLGLEHEFFDAAGAA